MNSSRRTALKTTGAFATLISLGLVTQSQAQAAVDRASFQVKTLKMPSRPSVARPRPATR